MKRPTYAQVHNRTINGQPYTILSSQGLSNLGSKYFGKYRFLLQDAEGRYWQCMGVRVSHNSRLIPASPAQWPNYPIDVK